MQQYLLFIDTETSGLPIDWTQPYSNNANWPYAVQVSWIVYTKDGTEIKREDHYIKDDDFEIGAEATKIHGITREFLNANGAWRKDVMELLYQDMVQYRPMIIGHYVELDYNIAGVDFFRLGMENLMDTLPRFCTMIASKQYTRTAPVNYLRLGQLYSVLFSRTLLNQHNAMVDAQATAECFFEMLRNQAITDETIEKQRYDREKQTNAVLKKGCGLPVLLFIVITLLIIYWI